MTQTESHDVAHDASPSSPDHVLTCLPYLIIFTVSVEGTYLRQPVLLYLCCSLYMHGWVPLTNALPGFSISHAALHGCEWVDGNVQNLTSHSRVISLCEEGKTESSALRLTVGAAHGNAKDLPVLVFLYFFVFLFPPVLKSVRLLFVPIPLLPSTSFLSFLLLLFLFSS